MTSYGGELRFTVTQRPQPGSTPLHGQPLVVLQGNGIVLEHRTSQEPSPSQPSTFTVPFREVSKTLRSFLSPRGVSIPGSQQLQHMHPFLGSKHGSGLTGSRPLGSIC